MAMYLVLAQAAMADVLIRQVHPDNPGGDYVELQFTAAGETIAGKHLTTYFSMGATDTDYLIPSDPGDATNQRTFLIGNGSTVGGTTPDLNAGLSSSLELPGQDGAVCLTGPAPGLAKLDCAAYGNYVNSTNLPVGTPAVATQYGETIERTIARGCATALDKADDTDNSAADFAMTADAPRNNSVTPTEKVCPAKGGATGGISKAGPPNTKIKKRPQNKSGDTSPTWKFKASEGQVTFKCKLDHKKFRKCTSPKTYKGLDPGKHKFKVEAIDSDGNIDQTPAKDTFKVLP
jgi:hypothetical protein